MVEGFPGGSAIKNLPATWETHKENAMGNRNRGWSYAVMEETKEYLGSLSLDWEDSLAGNTTLPADVGDIRDTVQSLGHGGRT